LLPDKEIVEKCIQQDRKAQRELYNRYISRMYIVCRRYINNEEELKDLIQDGFIKIFISIDKYRFEGPIEAWMRKIIVNTILMHIKQKKKNLVQLDYDNLHSNEDLLAVADIPMYEESEFSERELLQAIEQLPEKYKIPFNLHCFENYSHKEIAEMLSLTEEGSRSRLIRARNMIQEQLKKIRLYS
jgi:RNA polymerase sigma factor (sigma-70 family)